MMVTDVISFNKRKANDHFVKNAHEYVIAGLGYER